MLMEKSSDGVFLLKGLEEIAGRFDLIICDIWGVIHDGMNAYFAASQALARFRALQGTRPRRVILVSNAPRSASAVQRMLDRLGVSRDAYDLIVTSGDIAKKLVAERLSACPHERFYLLGSERDRALFSDLPIGFAPAEEANIVICTGAINPIDDKIEYYTPSLNHFRKNCAVMICANPDLFVQYGDRLVMCAGTIAASYEAMGGEVVYAGKPHPLIYGAAVQGCRDLDDLQPPSEAQMLAIGDAINTDIAGALAAGIPSLFVANGIHAAEIGLTAGRADTKAIADWLELQHVKPMSAIEKLAW